MRVDEAAMRGYVTFWDEDGDDVETWFPIQFEVCYGCSGKGTHVHRDIDGHGLTSSELYEDPDFAEGYFSGNYDVQCQDCGGERVYAFIDEKQVERMGAEKQAELEQYYDHMELEASYAAESAAERRMGA